MKWEDDYKEEWTLLHGDSMNIILSLLTDTQLLEVVDGLKLMYDDNLYEREHFPLSASGISHLIYRVFHEYWSRRGKGILIEDSVMRVVPIVESSYATLDWRHSSSSPSNHKILEENKRLMEYEPKKVDKWGEPIDRDYRRNSGEVVKL